MRVIHVLRKPLSEGTVAANVLKHGCGGINIDASRVSGQSPSVSRRETANRTSHMGGAKGQKAQSTEAVGGLRDRSSLEAYTTPRPGESLGRWPANVILQHLDGCRCEGIKKVKGSNNTTGVWGGRSKETVYDGGWIDPDQQRAGYTDKDGKESVVNWICVEGCPVAALDEQSGTLTSGKPNGVRNTGGNLLAGGGNQHPLSGFGDKGGASRFFKQVGGKTDE